MKNTEKSPMCGYGPHTQVKCQLEALIFGTCKKNINILSEDR